MLQSNAFGKLEMEYPGTLTGSDDRPMLFFEVYPQGSTFKSQQNTDTIAKEHIAYDKQDFRTANLNEANNGIITISPNPTRSKINVNIDKQRMNYIAWHLTDVNGKKVKSGNISELNFTIDLSVLEKGMYYLHIESDIDLQVFKIIKQ